MRERRMSTQDGVEPSTTDMGRGRAHAAPTRSRCRLGCDFGAILTRIQIIQSFIVLIIVPTLGNAYPVYPTWKESVRVCQEGERERPIRSGTELVVVALAPTSTARCLPFIAGVPLYRFSVPKYSTKCEEEEGRCSPYEDDAACAGRFPIGSSASRGKGATHAPGPRPSRALAGRAEDSLGALAGRWVGVGENQSRVGLGWVGLG
ncbi:hypothetical protein CALCODRAFT_284626 [Calocera cornea HHB12733]|uniref:Uncharacterized protein n=1 Tax=Calocera cornea HHB12733 TaxID=1353952 RepID=A0A165FZU2_9BASI|nr:hypothetical protein CALCODRAFT_284626 [Calocera cornea HHB12733]